MSRKRRLSPQAEAVLDRLSRSPACGVELIADCGLTSGTVYPLLARLVARGVLARTVVRRDVPGRPRVYYTVL